MNEKPQTLKPLGRLCMTIGQLPASYVESMSYYEQLIWLTKFLQEQVIPVVNHNSTIVNELQDYVEHYFDNLDVQEEINNKLDEMAESGQLTDIIAQYLGLAGMITFNTVAEMKAAENLVNGSKCQTLGYYSVNDEGGAIYKIRNKAISDVIDEGSILSLYNNNLVAELIIYDSTVSIKQFGAKGNGVTDDTLSIQHALDSEASTIIFNAGNYSSNSLLLNKIKNYHLKGNGECTLISKVIDFEQSISGRNNCLIESYGFYESKTMRDYCYIENINFNGNADNVLHVESHASASNNFGMIIWLSCFENVRLSNCKFYKTIKNAFETAYCKNVIVENNHFEKIGYNLPIATGKNAISCHNSMYNHLTTSSMYLYNTSVIIRDNYAKEIYNEFYANFSMQNVEIYNNICEKIGQYFIENLCGSDLGEYIGNLNVYNNKINGLTSQFINMNQTYIPTYPFNININNNDVENLGIIQLPDDESIVQYQPSFIYNSSTSVTNIYNIICSNNKVDLKTNNTKTIYFSTILSSNKVIIENNIITLTNTGVETIQQNYVVNTNANVSKFRNNIITINNTNLNSYATFYISNTNNNETINNTIYGNFTNTLQTAKTTSIINFSNNYVQNATQSVIKTTGTGCVANFTISSNYVISPFLLSVKSGDTITTAIVTSNFTDGSRTIKDDDSVIVNKVDDNNIVV